MHVTNGEIRRAGLQAGPLPVDVQSKFRSVKFGLGRVRRAVGGLLSYVLLALCLALAGPAIAADPVEDPPQVALTDVLIKQFLAMQGSLAEISKEIEEAGDEPDPKLQAKLIALATANGFKNFEEYDSVAASITLVMSGLDPDTYTYTDPRVGLREDIEDVKTDKTLTEIERKELIADLQEALRTTPDLEFPGNVDIVKKYAAEIEKVLE